MFNRLSDAEAERLAILSEELGEAVQIIGKTLRHGYESVNPFDRNGPTNRELLNKELGDIVHAINRMDDEEDVSWLAIRSRAATKAKAITKYLHHQPAATKV